MSSRRARVHAQTSSFSKALVGALALEGEKWRSGLHRHTHVVDLVPDIGPIRLSAWKFACSLCLSELSRVIWITFRYDVTLLVDRRQQMPDRLRQASQR